MKTLSSSFVVEAALAGLFAAAFVLPAAAQGEAPAKTGDDKPMPTKKAHHHKKKAAEKIHCLGINSCKGTSECSVEGKSQCKGMNACKGQGWVSLTAKTCAKKKGTVEGAKAPAAPAPAQAPAAK